MTLPQANPVPFTLLPPFYEQPLSSNPNVLLNRIEDEFSILIERYSYLKDAFSNDVFIVNEELVFRFPRTERRRKLLAREINFLGFLDDKVEVRIPKYHHVSENADFAGYALIPQSVLSPGDFQKLATADKTSAVDQLADFVSAMHNLNRDEFTTYQPQATGEFIASEAKVKSELVEKLFPKLSPEEVEVIERFYTDIEPLFQVAPGYRPTHGDLYAFNVIWDQRSSKVGVIDFSDLLIGDPARDFEVFFDYGLEHAERAYERYAGPKDETFLQRAEAYFRLHAIYTLLSSQLGALITFEHSRMRFRQKFGLERLSFRS